jgi:orotate phosphoribosyltransferase-like protein
MKKHSPEEVLAKLGRASELAERGLSQAEICSALGISVMTFHRWRKLPLRQFDAHPAKEPPHSVLNGSKSTAGGELERLHELQFENQRLRKLVVDLMLEKSRWQETHMADQKAG